MNYQSTRNEIRYGLVKFPHDLKKLEIVGIRVNVIRYLFEDIAVFLPISFRTTAKVYKNFLHVHSVSPFIVLGRCNALYGKGSTDVDTKQAKRYRWMQNGTLRFFDNFIQARCENAARNWQVIPWCDLDSLRTHKTV
jgi:hypothetical protein